MIDLFLISQLIAANPETQKFCAEVVGIPYESDNITEKEWQYFQRCLEFFQRLHHVLPAPPQSASERPYAASLPVVPYDASLPLLDA
jgi:hypothetical protein